MAYEKNLLAFREGFGSVVKCKCGQYHIHLPGVSVHLNEKGFSHLIQMILEAKENKDLQRLNEAKIKKSHLRIVKNQKSRDPCLKVER